MKAMIALCLCIGLLTGSPVYRNDSARQIYCCAPNSEKKIALTFDDGPHPEYTLRILSILKEYGVKATFFTIGENVSYYPAAFDQILQSGHEIGNHTYSHPHMQGQNQNDLATEIRNTEQLLTHRGAQSTSLFRPPEGVCSDTVCQTAKEMGYSIILWTVDTGDWRHTPADTIAENVLNNVKSGDIILFHDYISENSPTPDALRILLPALLEKGYQFVTVSELIGV